jgi:Xaa-Pro dipeptidase
MSDERSLRTAQAIRQVGADWAILTSIDTVCYATGHEVPIETGPSPFAGGPSTAIVGTDGTVGLVVANVERISAESSYATVFRTYEGFSAEYTAPLVDNYLCAVMELVRELGVGGVVAVEATTFPESVCRCLESVADRFVYIDRALMEMRATKTAAELEALRHCAELTAVGQRAALHAIAAGRKELEIFADIRSAMELAEGRRLPLSGDLLSGVNRTAQFTGWPIAREVQPGDPVICDLAPRAGGYWGDSCNTIVVGTPMPEFMRLYRAVREALEHATTTLRPGISAGQFDAEVRGIVRRAGFDYPHHSGHGIGTSVHEFPRLVPQETAILQPDMVLMVEPGAYVPEIGGVRLEWMFRVTPDGNEVLSPFSHTLEVAEL